MQLRLTKTDCEILAAIAEHRVLCIRHLAVLLQRNIQALRRRIRKLAEHGLIETASRALGNGPGRSEQFLGVASAGVQLLKEQRFLGRELPDDAVTGKGIRCVEHQLLVNDFRVQLAQMERRVPALGVRFLCATSPTHQQETDLDWVRQSIPATEDMPETVEFIPDGVMAISHTGLDKTLLFFLEADRGSETLASLRGDKGDLRQKILNYQALFRHRLHTRYEQAWGCSLSGFRLLLLAHSAPRLSALCRLVRGLPPSDFIWLTDHASLLAKGVWSAIWRRGGRENGPAESILGNQMPSPSPQPSPLA